MRIYMKGALVLSLVLTLSLQSLAVPAPFVRLPRARSHYLHARQETATPAPTLTAPSATTDSATPAPSPSVTTTDSATLTGLPSTATAGTTDSATPAPSPSITTTDSATSTGLISTVMPELSPTISPPTSVSPISPPTTDVPPTSVTLPVSVPPTSLPPTSVSPTSVAPTSVPPPTEVPTNSPVVPPTPPPLSPPPVIPPATTVTINPNPTPIPTLPTIVSTATPTISETKTSTTTGSVKGTVSGTGPLVPTTATVPVTTATTIPTVPVTPTLSTGNKTWAIIGGSAAGVLVLALACIFCIRRHRKKKQRNRKRLLASNDGLSSQTNIMGSNGGNDNDGENGDGDDDDSDLDSEKAFFMVNPVRVRSPQMTYSENHDLGVKTPLDQYEAQKYKWQDPIDVSNRHPQDHIRQQHLKRLLDLQQEQLIKLNALVERYRVIYSRPQSPHSPVTTETRLSTRLSFFPDDDDGEAEEEDLASEEIRKLELKGDERLYHVPPVEEGPFRDQGEIEDEDVELQLLEVNHHYQGPFQDSEDSVPMHSVGNIFDDINLQEDPNAVADADFEVASIIIRSGSINLLSDSLDLPSEYLDKGKATASSIRDSDSFLGLALSTRVSSDSLREAFGLRGSYSTLAASSTVGGGCSDSIMGVSSEYSGGVESSNSQGRQGGGGSGRREGRESPLCGSGTEVVSDPAKVWLPKIQTGAEMDQLERQREREQSEILMKAIAQVKAQYADQYRQIHEDLANLELEMEE